MKGPKLNLKSIDFKDLMIRKGERIGLGVALVIMALLVLASGYSSVTTASPTTVAKEIQDKAKAIENTIRTGGVTKEKPVDPNVFKEARIEQVTNKDFPFRNDLTVPNSLEDNKHRNPDVLPPAETVATLVRAQIRSLVTITDSNGNISKVGVLNVKETKPNTQKKSKRATLRDRIMQQQKAMQQQGPMQGMGAGNRGGGGPGMGGQGRGMGPGMGGQGRGMGPGMAGGPGMMGRGTLSGMGATKQEKTLDFADIKKAEGAQLAEQVLPLRMVVVSGSFPYKQQLEMVRRRAPAARSYPAR